MFIYELGGCGFDSHCSHVREVYVGKETKEGEVLTKKERWISTGQKEVDV